MLLWRNTWSYISALTPLDVFWMLRSCTYVPVCALFSFLSSFWILVLFLCGRPDFSVKAGTTRSWPGSKSGLAPILWCPTRPNTDLVLTQKSECRWFVSLRMYITRSDMAGFIRSKMATSFITFKRCSARGRPLRGERLCGCAGIDSAAADGAREKLGGCRPLRFIFFPRDVCVCLPGGKDTIPLRTGIYLTAQPNCMSAYCIGVICSQIKIKLNDCARD